MIGNTLEILDRCSVSDIFVNIFIHMIHNQEVKESHVLSLYAVLVDVMKYFRQNVNPRIYVKYELIKLHYMICVSVGIALLENVLRTMEACA